MKLAVTMGDAAGIGPEILMKTLKGVHEYPAVIFGRWDVFARLEQHMARVQPDWYSPLPLWRRLDSAEDELGPGEVGVVEVCPELEDAPIDFGRHDARAAHFQLHALLDAIEATERGITQAVVTAPWNKALFRLIEHPPVGHTEVLADRFGAREHVMMLAGHRLRVALVTTHLALRDVPDALSIERIVSTGRITHEALRERWGIESPRLAVCGLNPHAGEDGVMGSEEIEVIEPALERLRQEGMEVHGPFPSDTLFATFSHDPAPFDAVLCMYHDQGLIPLKLLHFGESANITLGLPIVRTSVDHGTAYDIAGRGIADPSSMRYALNLAARLATQKETS